MAVQEVDKAERAHRSTYSLFTGIMKYGTIITFILVMLVILIIS